MFVFAIGVLPFQVFAQELDWVIPFGGNSFDQGKDVTSDPWGNIYTTGYFSNQMDADAGADVFNLTSNGSNDVFLIKTSSEGEFLWAFSFGSTDDDQAMKVAVNDSGNVFVAGVFETSIDLIPGQGEYWLNAQGGTDGFIVEFDENGELIDAMVIGGPFHDRINSINIGEDQKIAVTGHFADQVSFGPESDEFTITSQGYVDAFVLMLDQNLNTIWVRQVGAAYHTLGDDVTFGPDGLVYACGDFEVTIDLNTGPETWMVNTLGVWDSFVICLDEAGNFMWGNLIQSAGEEDIVGIECNQYNELFVTGSFGGTTEVQVNEEEVIVLENQGGLDIYIAMIDVFGEFEWFEIIGSETDEKSHSLDVDDFGNIYLTGEFESSVDFDPSSGTYYLYSEGLLDAFALGLNTSGDMIWCSQMGSGGNDCGYGIHGTIESDVFVTGQFSETAMVMGTDSITSQGWRDAFLWKIKESPVLMPEIQEFDGFGIWPNPCLEVLNVRLDQLCDDVMVSLFSLSGELILIERHAHSSVLEIDLQEIPSGEYFIEIILNGTKKRGKIMKM